MSKNIKKQKQLKKFLDWTMTDSGDLGLVIVEKGVERPKEDFWRELDKDIIFIELNKNNLGGNLSQVISQAQEEGKRVVIDCRIDPDTSIIGLLREISHFGEFNLKNAEGNIIKRVSIRPGSLIVVASREFIENKISYSNFYNIFDSAFSLD